MLVSIGGIPASVCHKARKVEGRIIVDSYFWVGYVFGQNSKICKMDTTQMPVPVIVVAKALYSHNLREMGKLAELLTSLYAEEGGRI